MNSGDVHTREGMHQAWSWMIPKEKSYKDHVDKNKPDTSLVLSPRRCSMQYLTDWTKIPYSQELLQFRNLPAAVTVWWEYFSTRPLQINMQELQGWNMFIGPKKSIWGPRKGPVAAFPQPPPVTQGWGEVRVKCYTSHPGTHGTETHACWRNGCV